MTILVTGATGNVGGEVVRAVAAAGGKPRALVRNEKQRSKVFDGAETAVGDLNDPASLAAALDGVTGAFVLSGYADMTGLLAAIRDAGAQRVVQLSGSSAGLDNLDNAVTAYMARSEDAVRGSGLPYTILRPSAFMSNTYEWAPQLAEGDTVRAAFPDVAAAVIDPADIGAVAAAALVGGGHDGQIYRLTGPEALLPADRARILGEVLGREISFVGLSNDQARVEMSAAMPIEYVNAFFNFYVDGALDESPVLPTVSTILGRPPRTFHTWAATHSPAFK